MIDWPKVVQDLEYDIASRKQNMRHAQTYIKELESEIEAMKQDIEQFQMALREQVELNKNLERNLREFGMEIANTVNQAFIESVSPNAIAAIVDGVMNRK